MRLPSGWMTLQKPPTPPKIHKPVQTQNVCTGYILKEAVEERRVF